MHGRWKTGEGFVWAEQDKQLLEHRIPSRDWQLQQILMNVMLLSHAGPAYVCRALCKQSGPLFKAFVAKRISYLHSRTVRMSDSRILTLRAYLCDAA